MIKYNELEVKREYNTHLIIFDKKGTAVYMLITDDKPILCKSWSRHAPELAIKYIYKSQIFLKKEIEL